LARIQALDEPVIFGTCAKTPAARDVDELDAAALPIARKIGQDVAQYVVAQFLVEQLLHVRQLQRFSASQQRSLEYAFDFGQIERRCIHGRIHSKMDGRCAAKAAGRHSTSRGKATASVAFT